MVSVVIIVVLAVVSVGNTFVVIAAVAVAEARQHGRATLPRVVLQENSSLPLAAPAGATLSIAPVAIVVLCKSVVVATVGEGTVISAVVEARA